MSTSPVFDIALAAIETEHDGLQVLYATAGALVHAIKMEHQSMCPANRCTCHIRKLQHDWAKRVEQVMAAIDETEPGQ
jgi:hypothetical protein